MCSAWPLGAGRAHLQLTRPARRAWSPASPGHLAAGSIDASGSALADCTLVSAVGQRSATNLVGRGSQLDMRLSVAEGRQARRGRGRGQPTRSTGRPCASLLEQALPFGATCFTPSLDLFGPRPFGWIGNSKPWRAVLGLGPGRRRAGCASRGSRLVAHEVGRLGVEAVALLG